MNTITVGVLGASGYAGRELCSLINRHPRFSLAFASANDQRGASVRLGGKIVAFIHADDAPLAGIDLVFSALPHGASREAVARACAAGARAVDLSADLRPGNGHDGHPYGLTELFRDALRDANIVANPGCYPTAILLALWPLARRGLIAPGCTIVANAASGVTGAGSSPKRELLFGEIAEDYRAYAVGNAHRHQNEMRAIIGAWNADTDLVFTPHLLPVARGILASITVPLTQSLDDPLAAWREDYADERFIEVTEATPTLRDVIRRNAVRISATMLVATRTPYVLVTSAIDNLMKGAAGQAIQNANAMFGLDEACGLPD